MIQFDNASVADIKYGSQQVDKVYYGSTLVWEKNRMLEMTWGDDFYVPLLTGTASTNSNGFGFFNYSVSGYGGSSTPNAADRSPMRYYNPPVNGVFEGFHLTQSNGTTKNTFGTSNGRAIDPYIAFQFPFPVYVQEVKLYDVGGETSTDVNVPYCPKGSYNSTWKSTTAPLKNGVIRISNKPAKNLTTQANRNAETLYCTISDRSFSTDSAKSFVYDADINNTAVPNTSGLALYSSHTNSGLTDTPCTTVIIDPAADSKYDYLHDAYYQPPKGSVWCPGYGRIQIRFKVDRNDYDAWKSQYATELAAASARYGTSGYTNSVWRVLLPY